MTRAPDKHEMIDCCISFRDGEIKGLVHACLKCGVTKEALLEARVRELEDALRWYAEGEDNGGRARKALGRAE